jgi:hypothetical protein
VSEHVAGGTTAQSVSRAPSQTEKPPPRRGRLRAALPAIGAATLVGGALTVAFLRSHSPAPVPPKPPASAAHVELPVPPPAPTPASRPELHSLKLEVAPSGVSVEVDGVPSVVVGGAIDLQGTAGSMHMVRLVSGKREGTYPVLLTESGAVPRRVTLPLSPNPPPTSPAPKRSETAAPPASTPSAVSSSVRDPVSRTME